MTACSALFKSLDKKLEEKKTIDQIGAELCDIVDDPRGKAIRLIKAHLGEEYLFKNADWLGFDSTHIRNPKGARGTSVYKGSTFHRPNLFGQDNFEDYYLKHLITVLEGMHQDVPDRGERDDIVDRAVKKAEGKISFRSQEKIFCPCHECYAFSKIYKNEDVPNTPDIQTTDTQT